MSPELKTAIVYHNKLKEYDFGEAHPFRGDRYLNFIHLFNKILKKNDEFEIVKPRYATDEELLTVHHQDYLRYIIDSCKNSISRDLDTPLHPKLDKAARLVVGCSLIAGELVAEDKYIRTVGVGGGMHHARPQQEAGFCIYNDVAICVRNLFKKYGFKRLLILDTDAHTGDGTEEIFYSEPRVLHIDIHQDPLTLYPGRGFIKECGEGKGEGYTINIPLPPGASDESYKYSLQEIFIPLAREFKPQIILRNGGSDPHYADQLTNLRLTIDGFKMIGDIVRETADEVSDGRVIDLPGSGYNPTILPYAWLALIIGLTRSKTNIQEPEGIFTKITGDEVYSQTKRVVKEVKKFFRKYWSSLR